MERIVALLFILFSSLSIFSEEVPSPKAIVELNGLGVESAFTMTLEFISANHVIAYDNAERERRCEGTLAYEQEKGKFISDFEGEQCAQNNFIMLITHDEFLKLCHQETASLKLEPKETGAPWWAKDVTAKLISGSCY